MKNLLLTIIFVCLVFESEAQESLMANYPLAENGIDITGQNDEMRLINAEFTNDGVYSNGIYIGTDTTGTEIMTPPFTTFDYNDFSVLLDFYIESYPEHREPVIIGGLLWRWVGVYIQGNKLALMANDHVIYEMSETVVPLNQWNRIRISYSKIKGELKLFFNQEMIVMYDVNNLNTGDDPRFVNYHGGVGETFKGYWRNLVFYNTANIDAIAEQNLLSSVKIKAFENRITVFVPERLNGLSVQLFTINGKLLKTSNLGSEKNIIYVENPVWGYYLIRLSDKRGKSVTKKIILKE